MHIKQSVKLVKEETIAFIMYIVRAAQFSLSDTPQEILANTSTTLCITNNLTDVRFGSSLSDLVICLHTVHLVHLRLSGHVTLRNNLAILLELDKCWVGKKYRTVVVLLLASG